MRGQRHAPAALYPGKNPVPIVQEDGWAPGPLMTGVENLAPTGIRSPDRPARSQLLYRQSYPAPYEVMQRYIIRCTKYEQRYGKGKTQVFEKKLISVLLCPSKHHSGCQIFEMASLVLMGTEIPISINTF